MATAVKMVDPAQNEFLASLEAKSKKPSPFFRAMANCPEVLKNFVPLYGAIVGPGSVERRIKELVYLTCSYANECAYCTAAHVAGGKKAGDQRGRTAGAANRTGPRLQRAGAGRYSVRTGTDPDRRSADDSRGALQEHFNDEQIVEITLVAAMANFTNRFNNGLAVMPEA